MVRSMWAFSSCQIRIKCKLEKSENNSSVSCNLSYTALFWTKVTFWGQIQPYERSDESSSQWWLIHIHPMLSFKQRYLSKLDMLYKVIWEAFEIFIFWDAFLRLRQNKKDISRMLSALDKILLKSIANFILLCTSICS